MKEESAIKMLRICAWLNLIIGIIAALYVWGNVSERIKPGHTAVTEANPSDVITGVVFLACGVFGFAFFLVVCSIAESLIEIRVNRSPARM